MPPVRRFADVGPTAHGRNPRQGGRQRPLIRIAVIKGRPPGSPTPLQLASITIILHCEGGEGGEHALLADRRSKLTPQLDRIMTDATPPPVSHQGLNNLKMKFLWNGRRAGAPGDHPEYLTLMGRDWMDLSDPTPFIQKSFHRCQIPGMNWDTS